jgi:hypothetical protein
MMREEILNQKLKSLQTFIDQAKEISENGWLVGIIFVNFVSSENAITWFIS